MSAGSESHEGEPYSYSGEKEGSREREGKEQVSEE